MNTSQQQRVAPLYGLIVAGGHGVRMGQEKGGLTYGRRPQTIRSYTRLSDYCDHVYISIRDEQQEQPWCRNQPRIIDLHTDMGPVAGLLSAVIRQPRAAWLVLACDMPFVHRNHLKGFITRRNTNKDATAFQNPVTSRPEPLFAIYEPSFQSTLYEHLGKQQHALHRMLSDSDVQYLHPSDPGMLTSIDTPREYEFATERMKGKLLPPPHTLSTLNF